MSNVARVKLCWSERLHVTALGQLPPAESLFTSPVTEVLTPTAEVTQ